MPAQSAVEHRENPGRRRLPRLWLPASLLGIGLMGSVDVIVFHQLLQWHHFYVHASDYWLIASDGLIHAFTTAALFVGAVRLWQARDSRDGSTASRPFWGTALLGAGGFQLFDGVINHKVLQLHPVREGVPQVLPYDLAWNAAGLALVATGWLLVRGR